MIVATTLIDDSDPVFSPREAPAQEKSDEAFSMARRGRIMLATSVTVPAFQQGTFASERKEAPRKVSAVVSSIIETKKLAVCSTVLALRLHRCCAIALATDFPTKSIGVSE